MAAVDASGRTKAQRGLRESYLYDRLTIAEIRELLQAAGASGVEAGGFRRYGSARRLYAFDKDNAGSY
jgi:hypothetical protein